MKAVTPHLAKAALLFGVLPDVLARLVHCFDSDHLSLNTWTYTLLHSGRAVLKCKRFTALSPFLQIWWRELVNSKLLQVSLPISISQVLFG